MHINISEIPEEGLTLSCEEDLPFLSEETKVKGRVGVTFKIFKAGTVVSISGEIKATLMLECSRCLREVTYPLSSIVGVNYIPLNQMKKEKEFVLKRDNLDTNFYRWDKVDISELIKEQLFLSLPMQPLCSPDCKGLCPKCGKSLNEGPCTCEVKEIDPRLSILKKLKG